MGSHINIQQEGQPQYWCRDNFFLTTDKAFLDPMAVNKAFKSDLMWWNDPLESSQMRKMLDNCLTLTIYHVPDTEAEMQNNGGLPRRTIGPEFRMVGFARLVTDYVTIAYLTDVFILQDFQRRGLASWMMRAVKELVDQWPNLRGLMLMTQDQDAARMYKRTLGADDFDKGPSAGLLMMEMAGKGIKDVPQYH